jgi:flagellar basal-body rod modification protein FlgD
MSTIDTLSPGSTRNTSGASGLSALTTEDFSKIIFTELANQDPLSPNDTNALLNQISTLRSIQADTDLSDRLKNLVQQNQFASGAALLGKQISGVTDDNIRVAGLVKAVSNTSDGTVVTLESGERISMSKIDELSKSPE